MTDPRPTDPRPTDESTPADDETTLAAGGGLLAGADPDAPAATTADRV